MSIVLLGCNGNPTTRPSRQAPTDHGLRIECGINRGADYTDPAGTTFNLRYIPVVLTNESTTPIHVQIEFARDYGYPHPAEDDRFRVLPMPEEWTGSGDITRGMLDALGNTIDQPTLADTIAPGAELVLAIGTLYPRPPKNTGVLPRTLFVHDTRGALPECEWRMDKEPTAGSPTELGLGLELRFGGRCTVIPCGWISVGGP